MCYSTQGARYSLSTNHSANAATRRTQPLLFTKRPGLAGSVYAFLLPLAGPCWLAFLASASHPPFPETTGRTRNSQTFFYGFRFFPICRVFSIPISCLEPPQIALSLGNVHSIARFNSRRLSIISPLGLVTTPPTPSRSLVPHPSFLAQRSQPTSVVHGHRLLRAIDATCCADDTKANPAFPDRFPPLRRCVLEIAAVVSLSVSARRPLSDPARSPHHTRAHPASLLRRLAINRHRAKKDTLRPGPAQ